MRAALPDFAHHSVEIETNETSNRMSNVILLRNER